MPWLKRNLFLVVGGVVALALMGLAAYFLLTKIRQNQEVSDQLSAKTEELKNLVNRNPHPGSDKVNNIGAAKEEAKKLEIFLNDVKQHFTTVPYSGTNYLGTPEFKALLETTLDELQRGAGNAGVSVPKDYLFTFAAQKNLLTFQTNVLGTLAAQLAEIKSLCEIIFQAKVISLLGLRRVPVATEDSGTQDYLTSKPVTNDYAIATPYEVSFQGFSADLAAVLEGVIRAKTCFAVRNVSVDRADAPVQEAVPSSSSPYPFNPYGSSEYLRRYGPQGGASSRYGPQGGMPPEMRSRYGLAPPQPAATPSPTRPAGKGAFLDEKPLRITLMVDVVKLRPSNKPGK